MSAGREGRHTQRPTPTRYIMQPVFIYNCVALDQLAVGYAPVGAEWVVCTNSLLRKADIPFSYNKRSFLLCGWIRVDIGNAYLDIYVEDIDTNYIGLAPHTHKTFTNVPWRPMPYLWPTWIDFVDVGPNNFDSNGCGMHWKAKTDDENGAVYIESPYLLWRFT